MRDCGQGAPGCGVVTSGTKVGALCLHQRCFGNQTYTWCTQSAPTEKVCSQWQIHLLIHRSMFGSERSRIRCSATIHAPSATLYFGYPKRPSPWLWDEQNARSGSTFTWRCVSLFGGRLGAPSFPSRPRHPRVKSGFTRTRNYSRQKGGRRI